MYDLVTICYSNTCCALTWGQYIKYDWTVAGWTIISLIMRGKCGEWMRLTIKMPLLTSMLRLVMWIKIQTISIAHFYIFKPCYTNWFIPRLKKNCIIFFSLCQVKSFTYSRFSRYIYLEQKTISNHRMPCFVSQPDCKFFFDQHHIQFVCNSVVIYMYAILPTVKWGLRDLNNSYL